MDVNVSVQRPAFRNSRQSLGAAARREQFLQACWGSLGPTQREHLTSHCQAVSDMAYRLCLAMRLPTAAAARVRLAGLFHDIGKCVVPEELLAKPGPLTASQRRAVNQHAALGGRYTLAITGDARLAGIVERHHHPKAGAAAPRWVVLEAAIVQAADALVSMMSDRPYARARTSREALAELSRCAGAEFDPRVVRAAYSAKVWGRAA